MKSRIGLLILLVTLSACSSQVAVTGTATTASDTAVVGSAGSSSTAGLSASLPAAATQSASTTLPTATTLSVPTTVPASATVSAPMTVSAPTSSSNAASRGATSSATLPTPAVPTTVTVSRTSGAVVPANSCAQTTLNGLTTAQKIGQLLMIGVPIDDPASALKTFGPTPLGGIFLSGHATVSATTIANGISEVQQQELAISGTKLQVSVDEEGGQVQSLRSPDFPTIPDAVEQGQESTSQLRSATSRWAADLANIGVTLDLAPVADTVPPGTAKDNPPIGYFNREYGSNPDAVADSVTTVVTAMQGAGLKATVKHFPGLGRVTANTDTSTNAVDNVTTTNDPYFQPFEAAIEAGTTAVMISSARYPKLDPNNIAAFSSTIISGLLRGQLGFTGLVVSDDLGQAVAARSYSIGQRAVNFINAGGDMVLTVVAADLAPMTAALTAEYNSDASFRARVDDAALHVIASKSPRC